jgi:hypothetical protein
MAATNCRRAKSKSVQLKKGWRERFALLGSEGRFDRQFVEACLSSIGEILAFSSS